MLRFLSRRKARSNYGAESGAAASGGERNASSGGVISGVGGGVSVIGSASAQFKPQRISSNKNKIDCCVILLDNTDLSIELSVSVFIYNFIQSYI